MQTQLNYEMRCENCNCFSDGLIQVHITPGIRWKGKWTKRDKVKRLCFSCVRGSYWQFLREGGYWRRLFKKPAFNKEYKEDMNKFGRRGSHG